MKKVVITGASGFIGGALTQRLLSEGVKVFGIGTDSRRLEEIHGDGEFVPVIADFKKYESLSEAISDRDIDVFYHFAWNGVFGEAFKDYSRQLDNVKYTCEALMQAVKIGCKKFVFAGSMNEYEMDAFISKDYFEPRYTYIYSAAKQTCEAMGKTLAYNHSIAFCSGRIAMAYGERNKSRMIPNIVIGNLLTNTPCKLVEGNHLYDLIYIDDIVEAFKAIGEKGKHMKSYYVGHRSLRTFRELITNIAEILNPECPLLFGAYPDAASGVDYKYIDLEALYKDTGFECRADFRESIEKTAKWLETQICRN